MAVYYQKKYYVNPSPPRRRFVLRQMGHDVSNREAERMIRSADKNGDGLVNYQEFYEKMMQ